MKLESLNLEKFKENKIENLKIIFGGKVIADPETGCIDNPDCCTGDDCEDSEPDYCYPN